MVVITCEIAPVVQSRVFTSPCKILRIGFLSLTLFLLCRILNLAMNRLKSLPRGFGSFPLLEVLDLSYNYLHENVIPANFYMMGALRALYLR